MDEGADIPVATITIHRALTSDGDDVVWVDYEPDNMGIVETLGMLRMAEDSTMRQFMGEDGE